MGILDFLFGKASNKQKEAEHKTNTQQSKSIISLAENYVSIPALNFFGRYHKSPSGEWLIAWNDSDEETHRGGHRDSGNGRFVLCNTIKNTVILEGHIERPNSGSVADNGNFSIEDWHFNQNLSGTFYVFSSSGKVLIQKMFKANILNSAISPDGKLAICQTCNAKGEEDGNTLTAFDIERKEQLFSVHPKGGWANNYQFDSAANTISVFMNGVGEFRYSLNGEFLDEGALEQARLRSDRYEVALLEAETILKKPDVTEQLAIAALEAGERACSPETKCDPSWKALGFKVQGLAHEFMNNKQAALSSYSEALKINPKIGVKRKADNLRKQLGH